MKENLEKAAQTVCNMFCMTFKTQEKKEKKGSREIHEKQVFLEVGKYFYMRRSM